MTPREVLIRAKALIDTPEKWCQQQYHDSATGARCALGAIQAITGWPKHQYYTVRQELTAAIPKSFPDKRPGSYNDEPGRRHKTIMAWFDRAIAAAGTS